MDGFVGKRILDPGAFVGPNSPVVSVVDIRTVRMVANLIEKDSKRVPVGHAARRSKSMRFPARSSPAA